MQMNREDKRSPHAPGAPPRTRRPLAAIAVAACAIGPLGLATTQAESAHAASTPAGEVTITPNPWYEGAAFEGWGTSLVWFANATGGYPDELREELYQAVFGDDGLDLNIARYNIGGGNASDVEDYLRAGGAVDGWWASDADGSAGVYNGVTTTYDDRDALQEIWDPEDDAVYNWDADATQRWWVERLVEDEQITHWETFANSAPYFMTESGYVSGGFSSTAQQLDPASEGDFVAYLTRVTEHLEDTYGITVESIDPFNEPNTNYWGTTLTDGVPTGGRQEGMHVGPAQQADVIAALHAELAEPGTTTDAVIAAMDETNPSIFRSNWAAYDQQTRDAVGRMNVHTYGTGDRLAVRDLAKQASSGLWMSEIEGSWVNGWNPTAMANGLGMAGRVMDDIRELEPDAWVLWQPVEDLYNMEPQGENLNWGSVFIDLDCSPYDEDGTTLWKSDRRVADAGGDSTQVDECGVQVNSKFNTLRNFTKFITEGDRFVATDVTDAVTALKADGSGATIVYRNTSAQATTVTIDLSGFGRIAESATVTPYVTTEATDPDEPTATSLVPSAPVTIDATARTATVTVPAASVTTLDIDGVSGVSSDAAALEDGRTYQLVGTQSGKALTGADSRATITSSATTADAATAQAWTVHEVETEDAGTRVITLENGNGMYLGATPAGTDLRTATAGAAASAPETRWIVNTTDGVRFSLVNDSLAQSLDVGGQSTAENAAVGTYTSNGGANQSWAVRDLEPSGDQTISVRTDVGIPAVLPDTIVAEYAWGQGAAAPVSWDAVAAGAWDAEGTIEVTGTAIDVFGQEFAVTAVVDVGGLTVTDPVSLTVAVGISADRIADAAPTTVPARVGASESTFDVAVEWDFSDAADASFAQEGVVTVPGTADGAGTALDATLTVIVTSATDANFAPEPGVSATATSTESGYSIDRTRNGVYGDKGWSNWVSANKPAQDTLTYTFDEVHDVTGASVQFYADGSTTSWAQSMRVEYRDAAGAWLPVPGWEEPVDVAVPTSGAPTVEVDIPAIATDGIRIVMNAYANTHMTVSEVEIFEPVASPASVSTLAALRVDGVGVDGFVADTTEYSATVDGSRFPRVSAVAVDTASTVAIEQPTQDNGGTSVIVVTSADGSSSTQYTVEIHRRAVVSAAVTGEVRAGSTVRATVSSDPDSADVTIEWMLDGEVAASTATVQSARAAADESSFVIPDDAEGQELSVRVTAVAEGFLDAEAAVSDAVVIAAAGSDGSGGDGSTGGGSDGSNGSGSGDGTDAAGPGGTAGNGGDGADALAATGGGATAIALGAVLLLAGATALILRRRRA